jgi:hypothetical protein
MKHRETHPNLDVPGCFGCRAAGVAFSATAMPGRRPDAIEGIARDRRWTRDMDAYKRLRRDGLQPPQIDGSRVLETHAELPKQVEMGTIADPKKVALADRMSADAGLTA